MSCQKFTKEANKKHLVPLLVPRFFLAASQSGSFNNLRNLQNVGQTTPQIIPNLWRYTTASVKTQAGRQKLKHRRYAWTSERRCEKWRNSSLLITGGGLQCRLVFPTFQTTNSHSINSNNQRKESRLQSTNVAQIESNLSQKGIECSGPSSCDVLKVVSIPTHKYKCHMAYRSMCKQLHKPRNSSGYIGIILAYGHFLQPGLHPKDSNSSGGLFAWTDRGKCLVRLVGP